VVVVDQPLPNRINPWDVRQQSQRVFDAGDFLKRFLMREFQPIRLYRPGSHVPKLSDVLGAEEDGIVLTATASLRRRWLASRVGGLSGRRAEEYSCQQRHASMVAAFIHGLAAGGVVGYGNLMPIILESPEIVGHVALA
jgi:hypothetical protein